MATGRVGWHLPAARVNAERARANGYDRRWFSFPWFDGLGLAR